MRSAVHCLTLSVLGLWAEVVSAQAAKIDFVRDVQPIFSTHCYRCHGEKRQEGELRWDVKRYALQGGASGPVLVPGKSQQSLMIKLVAGEKPDLIMPQKGEKLTATQIQTLKDWIDEGAYWPDGVDPVQGPDPRRHWAFKAPIRPATPKVKNSGWVRNPIDVFILARLEQDNLQPSPEADRPALLRRLHLDLIGLPPTPTEIDEFLADQSPQTIGRVVERLVKSRHYGERWGRHWLDAARYADSNGFEKDASRSIWPYRDYVIEAFNRDLPFDQFTIEQLAGDLLPNPTLAQRVATGFLRNSMLNQEGGIEPEQFRVEALIDRMDAIGRSWLGLTIGCAQCHNHKYDPISQKEYYQFLSFINNDNEPFIEVPTEEQQAQREKLLAKVRRLDEKARQAAPNLEEQLTAWEKKLQDPAGKWIVLEPVEWHNFATKYEKQSDHSLLGGGDVKPGAVTHVWVDTHLANITGFRVEALMHPNLPYGGPGLVAKGSWLLKEFVAEAYASKNPTVTNKIRFRRAVADLEAEGFPVSKAIDGHTDKDGWTAATVPVRRNTEHRAVFECADPVPMFDGGTRIKFTLYQKHSSGDGHSGALDKDSGLDSHAFGRFRLSATTANTPLQADPLNSAQREWLAKPPSERTPEQQRELWRVYRETHAGFAGVNKEIDSVYTNWPYAGTSLGLQVREEPRQTRIWKRGDWQRPGDAVEAGVPAVLPPLPAGTPRNRLGLAQWLVDRKSPTTARVIVNRIWQAYFGQGLFTTPEDIGTRVEAPSHPDLLDWLACEFMDRGWSFKAMHRLITDSATYRQSSVVPAELYTRDPYNRLLARGPRFRVEGEIIQDIALSASGLLNPRIGGPGVRPPIPASVADTVYGGFSWSESAGEDRYRRGMYTFWKRALPFPALLAFDAPTAEFSCTRRVRSNTPLQALTTLNEKTFVEAAQALGLRVYKEGGRDTRSRATYAFRLCTGRAPDEPELASILRFYEEQLEQLEERSSVALKIALPKGKDLPDDVNVHKVAAWAMVGRAILNLDETITKE